MHGFLALGKLLDIQNSQRRLKRKDWHLYLAGGPPCGKTESGALCSHQGSAPEKEMFPTTALVLKSNCLSFLVHTVLCN